MIKNKTAVSKITASPLALLFPAVLILMDAVPLLLATIICAAAHEAGHLFGLKIFRGRLLCFKFGLMGCSIEHDDNMSYPGEAVTALLGPIASFILAAVAAIIARLAGHHTIMGEFCYMTAGVSLALGAFNLLPAIPLDGARALYCLFAVLFNLSITEKIMYALRCAVIGIISAAGMFSLIQYRNPALLICAAFLIMLRE